MATRMPDSVACGREIGQGILEPDVMQAVAAYR
jgi:hypothetical protein